MTRLTATPRIIAVTGVDGSGKTTLTDWLREESACPGAYTSLCVVEIQ